MIGDDPTLPEITAPQPLDPYLAAGPLPDLPGPARRRQGGGWLVVAGLMFLAPVLGGAYIGEPLSRAINGQSGDLDGDVVEGFDGPGVLVTTTTLPASLVPPVSAGPPSTTSPPPSTSTTGRPPATSAAAAPPSSSPTPPSTTTSTSAPPDTSVPSTTSTSTTSSIPDTVPETTTTSTGLPDPSLPLP